MAKITIHTDGASRGNPGAAAIAYVIERPEEELIEHAETIGSTTNNQAEYQALVAALEKLISLEPTKQEIECLADSELIVKQVRGEYKMKNVELRPHYEQILDFVSQLKKAGNKVTFTAVRRAANKRADALCNHALDGDL